MSTVYSKICIICNTDFDALKINALYCSKKCRNRARYLPTEILNTLISRNAKWVVSAKNLAKTMTPARFTGYQPKNATVDNPLGEDLGLLIAHARMEAEKRGIRVSSSTDNLKEDILKSMTEGIEEKINTEDSISDADGFGVVGDDIKVDNIGSEAQSLESPEINTATDNLRSNTYEIEEADNNHKPKGLRKLGGGK